MGTERWMLICQWGMYWLHVAAMAFVAVNLLKYKGKSRVKGCIGIATAIFLFSILSRWIMSYTESYLLNFAMCTCFVILLLIMLFEGSFWKKVVVALTVMAMMVVVESAAAFFMAQTIKNEGRTFEYSHQGVYEAPEYVLLVGIYSSILCFVCCMLFIVIWKAIVEHFWIKEYLLYIIIPLYQFSMLVAYYSSTQKLERQELMLGMVIAGFSILVDVGMVYLVNGMIKKITVEQELENLYNQRKIEVHYYELANQNIEEMRKIRYDFSNQLQIIYDLLEKKKEEEVKELLDQSCEQLKSYSLKRYCENAIVNSILTIKEKNCTEMKIELECKCSVSERINIEIIDICSLFSNLLDNAMEACEKITPETEEKRWISVHASEQGGFLIVKVKNPYSGEIKDGFLTSKEDRQNHGYGLKLIRQIVKKYNGRLEVETKNGVFCIVAALSSL